MNSTIETEMDLSVVAKKILIARTSSSVSSERFVSLSGNIVNKKRAWLTSSNVEMLVFLNKNMDYYYW